MNIVLTVGILSLAFYATGSASQEDNVSKSEWCSTVANLAGSMMSSRQNGVALDDILKAIGANKSESIRKISRFMVIDAFEKPLYLTEDAKQREIKEFKNRWQLTCIKS